MNILGIDWGEHDNAAALLQDGKVTAAAEEERFSRAKHAHFSFPAKAANYCMSTGNITPSDTDIVAVSFSPITAAGSGLGYAIRNFPHSNFIGISEIIRRAWYFAAKPYARYSLKFPDRTRFIALPHHITHAASAFFASDFNEAAILVVDGVGEWASTSLYHAQGKDIKLLGSINFPHSLGFYYTAFTEYLGFEPFDGEYKVMGMAAYGDPERFSNRFSDIVKFSNNKYRLNLNYFNFYKDYGRTTWYSPYMITKFGPRNANEGMPQQIYLDIAAGVQQRLEETFFYLINYLREQTGSRNLCLAGGVALNSVANGKVVQRGLFERIFIQPAANDAGCALGAALYVHYCITGAKNREPFRHVYLGPEYSSSEIESFLRGNMIIYETLSDPAERAAELLTEGKIVGWFQGRMEFGPRALGNRSILADPRSAGMKDQVNAVVKFREPFRPFAPSVPEEDSDIYFEPVGGSPFMIRVTKVRSEAAELIPAVTHVDGTARLHTVNKEVNELYWRLLKLFGEKTGVPVLLNTSFNVKGEPIVCNYKEAIACFYNSGLDALILDKFLLRKNNSDSHPE
ncbi:MAG: carbamoyltransferase [Dehalococcoidia bacterium]